MDASERLPNVHVQGHEIVVRYLSAVDGSPSVDTIHSKDIVQIVLERLDRHVHWFLRHRAGWTLHFHDGFEGATATTTWLQGFAGFSVPTPSDIAGPGGIGTVVWSSA